MLPDNYGDNPWSAQVAASGGGLGGILAKLFGGGQSAPSGLGIAPAGAPMPPPRPVGIGAPMPPPRPTEFSGSPNEITVTPGFRSGLTPEQNAQNAAAQAQGSPGSIPGRKPRVITPGASAKNDWAPSPFLWSGRVR